MEPKNAGSISIPAQAEATSILTEDSFINAPISSWQNQPRLLHTNDIWSSGSQPCTEGRFRVPIMSHKNQQCVNASDERRLVSKAIRAAGYIFDGTIYVHDDAESESSEFEFGLLIRNQSSRPSQGSLHESSNIHEVVKDEDIDKESEASGSDIIMSVSVCTIPMKSSIVASAGKDVDHRPVAYAGTMAVLAIFTKGNPEDLLCSD
ncbi:hypothetical protein FMUND_13591 [Fusarium mundagurra]|uniref:Uncharacterized protein n=1 Tax=Fusarium mundagurra TaxID=1567541 RepID=A0A8H5XYK3_9HYPO|nr:hypothetical protein FMUND_13591 [Fusarium mundagurra]